MEGMDRPVGPLPMSVMRGTNADLIAAVAPVYLTGSVLDVTYGNGDTAGGWWRRFTPDPFTFHDLALDGVDFRSLPESDGSVDTVCFDPPYVDSGGLDTRGGAVEFRNRFGLVESLRSRDIPDLFAAGLSECCRVARSFVLVKCMEFTQGGRFHDLPVRVANQAAELGWVKHDTIVHHTGSGPGGHNIWTVKRARRAHSYLLVFAPARGPAPAATEGRAS